MDIIYISLLALFASFVGTVTGFGTSTIMLPVVTLFYGIGDALLLVGIIHWFTDIWNLILFRKGLQWSLITSFGIPGIIASLGGASLTSIISHALLGRLVGGFLAAYVLILLLEPALRLPRNNAIAVSGGAVSGFLGGLSGISGPVRSAFLAAFDLPKVIYLATGAAIALAIDSARLPIYVIGGTRLPAILYWGLIAFIPVSLLGAVLGRRFDIVPQKSFRLIIALGLLAIGIKLLISP